MAVVENKEVSDAVIRSSGNVFDDLGLTYSPEDYLKVRIAIAITATITKRNLTQTQAAQIISESQPRVSDLTRGRLGRFSVEKLFGYLMALGHDINISISRPRDRRGNLAVKAA
jgi:predicted XRE-type DNA-binding protein